ncbi:MAG: transposase [Erysipelotrichaceae bacterium]|nr:transposase [Erysipelotrichaceae bacterium]
MEREERINHSVTNKWLKKYLESEITGLENQKKPGNPFARYSNKKNLAEPEKLEYEIKRRALEPLIKDIHKRKPSYGYHRINAIIHKETGWIVSDNLVHKVCKILTIRSKARHYSIYKKPKEKSIKYPNLINNNWETTKPFEKIASDTTLIWFRGQRYDWIYYIDAFDNSIIGSDVKPFYHGVNMTNHMNALNDH